MCAPCGILVADCVIAELQVLPKKYGHALRVEPHGVGRDGGFKRLTCSHKGTGHKYKVERLPEPLAATLK